MFDTPSRFLWNNLEEFQNAGLRNIFWQNGCQTTARTQNSTPKNSQNAPDKSLACLDGLLHFYLVLISKHPWFWKKSFLSNPEDASSWRSDGPEKRCQVICGRVDQLPSVPCGGDKLINPIVGVYILSIISIIIIYIIYILNIYIYVYIYISHYILYWPFF